MKKILVATQHNLTSAQIESLNGAEFVYLKDVNPDLFNKLASMNGEENLVKLTNEFINTLKVSSSVALDNYYPYDYVIMPIGSPAFNANLCVVMGMFGYFDEMGLKFLYSHSDRMVVENFDGSKTVTFQHKKWIEVRS